MKKKLLSIALIIALVAGALVPAVMAANQETGATIGLVHPYGGGPGIGDYFAFSAVGDLHAADIETGFDALVEEELDGYITVVIDAIEAEQEISVTIDQFAIDGVPTMVGFNLTLEVVGLVERGEGDIDLEVGYTFDLNVAEGFSIVTSADEDALYRPTLTFEATLCAPEFSAYRMGDAVATITWEVVPVVSY